LWRSLSSSCPKRAWAWRNRPKRKPRPRFSVLKSDFLIFSGRVPLARSQNSRNGGRSGTGGRKLAATAERLGAPPRTLRPRKRLDVFIVASAQRPAWKKVARQSRAVRNLSGATLAPRIKH